MTYYQLMFYYQLDILLSTLCIIIVFYSGTCHPNNEYKYLANKKLLIIKKFFQLIITFFMRNYIITIKYLPNKRWFTK